jgi:exosortase
LKGCGFHASLLAPFTGSTRLGKVARNDFLNMADNEPNLESQVSDEKTAGVKKADEVVAIPKPSLISWLKQHPVETTLLLVIGAVLTYFYGFWEFFGNRRELSPIMWMWKVCAKEEFDYRHGHLIPLIIVGLLWYRWPKLVAAKKRSEWWGLAIAIIGILFFVMAARVVQARVAAGSLPIVAFGLIAYIWGRHVARYLFFPCCLIYFAIPLPGLMQATTQLQVFSTQIASLVGGVFGIELHAVGSKIQSVPEGKWNFQVDEGCSGIRSLVALTLIAAIYGHLTQDKLWKKILLIASALPLAVLANAGRVSTIVLIAEFIDVKFAASTYHNWSGFVFFLLFGLSGLLFLAFLINGGLKKLGRRKGAVSVVQKGGAAAS